MGELRDRMVRDMNARNFSPRTIESYVAAVAALARYYNRRPDQLKDEEIAAYQRYVLHERKLATSSCSLIRHALKFFYGVTAPRPSIDVLLPRIQVESKLPEILSREEVGRIIDATKKDAYRLLLMFAYGSGLRLGELIGLRVGDVDLERKMVRVVQGKGRKDRYTVLPWSIADELERYFERHGKPPLWVFTGARDRSGQMDDSVPQKVYYRAKLRAGVTKRGGIHALRHAFATHSIEDGYDLPTLSRMMGHNNVQTTMRYMHMTEKRLRTRVSPLDRLDLRPDRP